MTNNPYLDAVAALETAGGKKTIKGPNGEDSLNLFNIKQFNRDKPGFTALDRAEGSRDAYRVYGSVDESVADMQDLLRRKYPRAYEVMQQPWSEENMVVFAQALKEGGYATDPAYVEKLVSVARRVAQPGAQGTPLAPALPEAPDPTPMIDAVLSGNPVVRQMDGTTDAAYEAAVAGKQARDAVGFTDVVGEKFQDPRANGLWAIVEHMNKPKAVANFSYWDAPERVEWEKQAQTEEELQFLRENATSEEGARWALEQITARREKDQLYAAAGAGTSVGAELLVGLADPVGWAIGLGAGKVVQAARVAQRFGRVGAAGAVLAEGAAGNVAFEYVQDSLGEVKTLGDYGMAAAFGAALSAPFIPFAVRDARTAQVDDALQRVADDMSRAAVELRAQGKAEGLTPDQQAAREATVLRQEVDNASRLGDDNAIVPRDLVELQRAADETPPAPEPELTKPTPPKAEPAKPQEGATVPPQPEPKPDVQPESPRLPKELQGAKPRYQQAELKFASDLDRALYIVAHSGRLSKSDAQFMAWLRKVLPGKTDEQIRAEGAIVRAGVRSSIARGEGGVVKIPDQRVQAPPTDKPREGTLRAALADAKGTTAIKGSKVLSKVLDYLEKAIPASILDGTSVEFTPPTVRGHYINGHIKTPSTGGGAKGIDITRDQNEGFVLLHEAVHAATVHVIRAVRYGVDGVTMAQKQAVERLNELRQETLRAMQQAKISLDPNSSGLAYAVNSPNNKLEEFVSQVLTDRTTQNFLAQQPGRGYQADSMLDAFIRAVVSLVMGVNPRKVPKDSALAEAIALVDTLVRTGGELPTSAGVTYAPSPQARAITDLQFADRMYQHARDWVSQFPIDGERLKVLAQQLTKKGSTIRDYLVSDGLKLAASKNPIMQMMSGLLVETTTGAAGRRSTAAIHKALLHKRIIGASVNEYHTAYGDFRKRNGGSWIEDMNSGEVKRKFDRAVYEEILSRRYGNNNPTTDGAIRAAADAMERMFGRSLEVQKEASTLGSGFLPSDSVGYVPQALNADALAAATPAQREELAVHLTDHWVAAYGWSHNFAKEFSRFYIKRARERATGASSGVDFVALESPSNAVRDALEAMKLEWREPNERARAELDRVGAVPQNKRRLDVDLTATLPSGAKVLDFYSTDVERMARAHANVVAGHAALASKGILGQRGVNSILRAIDNAAPEERATPDEVAALKRTFSEFLGVPIDGERRSELATGLASFTRLQRLGGLAFTQLAETANLVHHLGLSTALKALGSLPRQVLETRKLVRGEQVVNPWLASIERHQGFELGLDNFRLVAPLDAPDALLREYGKGNSIATRALQGGNYLQAKLSFFRGIHAAQHRATAEHILKRAIGYIQDGKPETDRYLQDMGITPALATSIRQDLGNALLRNANGDVIGFDIAQLTVARTRDDLIQAIHRGTAQIIQDSFIGERGAWAHDDWAKVLLQLRTFGLTAMEKQWGRTRAINSNGPLHGYGYAAGVLLGQMAFATMIYGARAQLYAAGREDREAYLEQAFAPASLVQAGLNYSSMSGLAGDAFDLMSAIGGGWSDDVKASLGTRSFATGVGGLIPVAGTIDAGLRVVQGKADLHTALKQLPGSNLPWIAPILNLAKED